MSRNPTASKADVWTNCGGWLDTERPPYENSDRAERGKLIHAAVETSAKVGDQTPHGTVTEDEYAIVAAHESTLAELMQRFNVAPHNRATEAEFPTFTGRPCRVDELLMGPQHTVIYDLKTGLSRVSAVDNAQLNIGAYSAAQKWPTLRNTEPVFVIHSPASYVLPYDEWTTTWSQIDAAIARYDAVLRQPIKTLQAGRHCSKCDLFGKCSASIESLMAFSHGDYTARDVHDMADPDLGALYQYADEITSLAKSWQRRLGDALERRLQDPANTTGLVVERKPHGRKWLPGYEEQVRAAALVLGIDPDARKLRTFSQLRDAAPASVRDVVKRSLEVCSEPAYQTTIKPASDTLAARVFSRSK